MSLPIRLLAPSLALLASGAVLFGTSRAEAAECTSDTDCDKGFTCQVTGGEACADVACPEGADCPKPPPCEPKEYKECVPGPCKADADCAADMVCLTDTYTECSGGGAAGMPDCAPGTDCPEPPPPEPSECNDVSVSQCAPKWLGPCTVAADCGDGFKCSDVPESCACSGSAGTDPGSAGDSADGGAPTPAPAPDCVCEPSTEKYCEAQGIACGADTDCPSGWTCSEAMDAPTCASVEPAPAPDGDAGSAEPIPPPDCGPAPEPKRLCMPPYADTYGGGPGVYRGDALAAGAAESGPTGAPPKAAASDDSSEVAGSTSDESGSASGATSDEGSSDSSDNSKATDSKDEGGCTVKAPGSQSGASMFLLGLVAAAGLFRRRRV